MPVAFVAGDRSELVAVSACPSGPVLMVRGEIPDDVTVIGAACYRTGVMSDETSRAAASIDYNDFGV